MEGFVVTREKHSQGESPRRSLKANDKEQLKQKLMNGYKEMSRINLMLAEEALESDNQSLRLCEQKLAECE